MKTATEYLDPATLSAVDSLELRARMVVEGLMVGMHRSPHQGFSIEFAQHRQYVPGDDLRYLDWKVFGRADKLYLKQYQQETNLDLVILVDASGSMAYTSGPWRKYDLAATVAGALAHLALRQQDRVGLVIFNDTVEATTRTSNAHGHWRAIIEALSSRSTNLPTVKDTDPSKGRGTPLDRVFEHVLAKLRQRSVIALVSDLIDDPAALQRGLARAQFSRHDVMVMQTLDPAELTFPFRAPSRFLGLEGEGEMGLDPSALREGYMRALQEHLEEVERITRQFRFDYTLLDTSKSLGAPLGRFLAWRAAAVQKGRSR